jgi:hypothetical protein
MGERKTRKCYCCCAASKSKNKPFSLSLGVADVREMQLISKREHKRKLFNYTHFCIHEGNSEQLLSPSFFFDDEPLCQTIE